MIGLVVATHGNLGESLLVTAQMIVGTQPCVEAVSLSRSDSPERLHTLLAAAIERAGSGCDAVLLATDMFGGTPTNIGMTLIAAGQVELLTGVNLPMVLKFFSQRTKSSLAELAVMLKVYAQQGVVLVSEAITE